MINSRWSKCSGPEKEEVEKKKSKRMCNAQNAKKYTQTKRMKYRHTHTHSPNKCKKSEKMGGGSEPVQRHTLTKWYGSQENVAQIYGAQFQLG